MRGLARSAKAYRQICPLLLLLCSQLSPAVVTAQLRLPDFSDSSAEIFSGAEERKLGDAFMREVRASSQVLDDPVVEQYIESVGHKLVAHAEDVSGGFHFFVVNEAGINAFAGPGGHIGVNTGLILAANFEGELASVLAHEIAHVTQRHLARRFELADNTSIPVLAGMLAAAAVGLANPQAGQAAIAAVTGASLQLGLDFSRANELEADRVGMRTLSRAGFDPKAMPAFFEKLQAETRFTRRAPEYLSTHPVTSSRIADSRNRAVQYPYKQHADSDGFHLVKARLAILGAKDVAEATKNFASQLESGAYRNLGAAAYGFGLGLMAQQQARQAEEVFAKLTQQHPEETAFIAARAEAALEAGDVDRALQMLSEGAGLFPGNKVIAQVQINALIRARQASEALRVLEGFARLRSKDSAFYKLEARAHEQLGNVVESQLALAEHYYADGNLAAALQQLRLATSRRDADYYTSSRVAARLRQLESEQAQRTTRR